MWALGVDQGPHSDSWSNFGPVIYSIFHAVFGVPRMGGRSRVNQTDDVSAPMACLYGLVESVST